MKTLSLVTALAAAVSLCGAQGDSGALGEPLFIYVKSPGAVATSELGASPSSSYAQATAAPTTAAQPTSSAPMAPASQPPSSAAASTSTAQASPTSGASAGSSIPNGQGNSFTVPQGAVRFPWNYGNGDKVVPITPTQQNGGWAMSPDQMCKPNSWCPYACESGYYAAQWDPSALLYNGAGSMNGGLYADASGVLSKPFPDRAFCERGLFNAFVKNTLGKSVSACQTVYPGNESMLIPTVVQAGGTAPLNVVPSSYWLGTSSQFYVNLAGSTDSQCIWGTASEPVGNWGAFIFGAGQGKDGNTYISVQYNPLYLSSGFKATDTYNVRIECVSGNCNFPTGGECKCEQGVCSLANGCTVGLPSNAQANFVLY
ncbi:hypothetical protein GGI26_005255 [Coemansia sp. RSA 1358]|nr:hypothetical protein EDC05_004842 [Coemansia umbellata]KAJ2620140.1 hypothetical protein GGI26_005255 [Coemansia sp. RSA 1358]